MNSPIGIQTPFNQTTLVATRWGHMMALACDPYQTGSLTMYGEWARSECSLLCSFLEPGAVAVDAGANIGTLTIPMAKKVGPTGIVLAFEPQRYAYMCLCGNVALTHCLHQVRTYNVAVSDSDQPLEIGVHDLSKAFNIGGIRIGDPAYDDSVKLPKEPVPAVTIDQFKLTRLDLLKIDVEGMEAKILAGAQETITRCRPVILAEALHDLGAGRENANLAAMLAFFKNSQYRPRFAETSLYSDDNIRFCRDNIFPGGDRNIIALHQDHPIPPWWDKLTEP